MAAMVMEKAHMTMSDGLMADMTLLGSRSSLFIGTGMFAATAALISYSTPTTIFLGLFAFVIGVRIIIWRSL